MIHTNINDLIEALKLYRDEYGDKGEIMLENLEDIILYLKKQNNKKKKGKKWNY